MDEDDPILALRGASVHQDDPLNALRGQTQPANDPLVALRGTGDAGGDITLKPQGEVTVSPLKPIGIRAEDIARAASTGTLRDRIAANIQIAQNPELEKVVQPLARKLQAPGTLQTAANIAMSNLIAPIWNRAAESATQHDLDEYAAGGGDPSAHANLFGAVSALGAVAGNVGIAGVGRAIGKIPTAGAEALPATPLARIVQAAKSSAKVNAGVGAAQTALFGDESGNRDLGAIAKSALIQGGVGAALGAGLGSAAEGVATLAALRGEEIPNTHLSPTPDRVVPGAPVESLADPTAVPPKESQTVPGADEAVEYRHAGIGLVPKIRDMIRTGYRGAMVTPYANIENEAPELVDALNTAGASRGAASHIADRRAQWVTEGLNSDQRDFFGKQLVHDNLVAEAERKAQSNPEAAANFAMHAAALAKQLPDGGVHGEPWFQDALAKHQQYVEPTMTDASIGAGVDPSAFRQPESAYVKLVSEDRLHNAEVRRAMDAAAVADPDELAPRTPLLRKILGENPELRRLFPKGATGLRQGPLNPNVPSVNVDTPIARQGASQSGSAQTAQGTAREYVTDYGRIIRQDANDKIVRSAKNAIYDEVAKVGRPLGPGDEPALGKKALERTVLDANGEPTVQRWEVSPKVKAAVDKFEARGDVTDRTGLWRRGASAMTRLQISGMPVEATSHMNTLASIVASVPGEKDLAGKAAAAVPGIGAKAAAIREMAGLDFTKPETRALESRLADIGALRIDEERGGLINSAHHALFGPEGVDARGRLVLARKYLQRKPDASDAELREFITSKLGNYNRANSGAAVNALQDAGISSFARFQAARIPSSIRATFGASGLPSNGSKLTAAKDIANTLYRGPLGYATAGELANRAIAGHSMADNEKGHQMDVQLPFAVGQHKRPVYLPLAFLNPVLATGLRATGARDMIPFPGHANSGGELADALRDVENTGLGVLSPAARALSIATSGRTPYLNSDGSFLRVTDPKFNKGTQLVENAKAAVSLANPALAAFAEKGGDVGGNSLADALAQDGKRFGGTPAASARVAEFLLPRVATVGVGGRDAETSQLRRDEREYNEAINGYKSQIRRAAGGQAEDAVIEGAVKDAESDGRFDPAAVRAELVKYANTPQEKRDQRMEQIDRSFSRRKLR